MQCLKDANRCSSSEPDLRIAFEKYGTVQTCIVNKDKRHAFVKMLTRADAVTAKETMEQQRAQDMQGRNRSVSRVICTNSPTNVNVVQPDEMGSWLRAA